MTNSALSPEIEAIVAAADAAAPALAAASPKQRAKALVAVADALEAHGVELIQIAMSETGLTEARLTGELKRTAVQLRLFADTVVAGEYLDVRIDAADPNFALGQRPDLRRYHIPVGPVLNFSASNFPFAFSVAGGDSAAALAAGAPLIVKGHSGHPALSVATAKVVRDALAAAGMPAGTFDLILGQEAGVEVLKDPRIKAGSFTGSIHAGRMLADIAASRPTPIPFFGELGSVNPVFVTAAAIAETSDDLAAGFMLSVAGSAGQLCTKPGFVFAPVGHGLDEKIVAESTKYGEHRLLNPRIAKSYAEGRQRAIDTAGVRVIVEGGIRFDDQGQGWATPTVVAVGLDDFHANRAVLAEEVFGPFSIIVEYPADADLAHLLEDNFAGNLTATVHLSSEERAGKTANFAELQELVLQMSKQAGRVLFGGWPTGVAVTPAQQHGGPYPATTNDSSTSVGTAAIQRAPEAFLPAPLTQANEWNIPRTEAPAGESTDWGSQAR